nr:hypothetical protein [Bacteroidota bacterium]
MSTENSIIELAERYVNGQMLPDEQREFELKVQNNAYLAKIVNEFVCYTKPWLLMPRGIH